MIKDYCERYEHDQVVTVRGISVMPNSGKGNAFRTGFLYSKGRNLLVIDADGATAIADYERLQARLDEISGKEGIGVGSRRIKSDDVKIKVERTFMRDFVSKAFIVIRTALIGLGVKVIRYD